MEWLFVLSKIQKHRILILLGDDESEPYSILKLYDLDNFGDSVTHNGYYNDDKDKRYLVDKYCRESGKKLSDLDIRYIEKASDGEKASNPNKQTALKYFEESEPIDLNKVKGKDTTKFKCGECGNNYEFYPKSDITRFEEISPIYPNEDNTLVIDIYCPECDNYGIAITKIKEIKIEVG